MFNKISGIFSGLPRLGLSRIIDNILKSNMSTDDKFKAIKLFMDANSRSPQNKLKLLMGQNFSRNTNVRSKLVNYLSNMRPPPSNRNRNNTNTGSGGGSFKRRLSRFEEILASNRNSRSKAQELIYLLKSDPTNLNRKVRLIGNAKGLNSNNRDDIFDIITGLKQNKINSRRKIGGGFSNYFGSSSTVPSFSSGSNNVGFKRQIPYTGNGGAVFGGVRNNRSVSSSLPQGIGSSPQRNNGGMPRFNNSGGAPFNNGGVVAAPFNNGGVVAAPLNNGGMSRLNNSGVVAAPFNNRNMRVRNVYNMPTKKKCRPVKMKLLKGVVSDITKKKLVSQVKKLGKKDAKKQKKDELIKFIVKRIRPPASKKKKTKKSVQPPPVKENKGILIRNKLNIPGYNVSGTGNQGIRQTNVRNTSRNGFIP